MIAFPPDITFVIQIVSFFLLWMGLKRLLFDPVLKVLEERRARTEGVRAQAAQLRSEVERAAAAFDLKIAQVRSEIGLEADAARNATDDEERRVLATARDQANAHIREESERVRAQADAARSSLAGESAELAGRIVERVVGARTA
jgi:F-type H+-transporting ATPase subunit b